MQWSPTSTFKERREALKKGLSEMKGKAVELASLRGSHASGSGVCGHQTGGL